MNETLTVEVTTQVFGLGATRATPPTLIELRERTISARDLIAEHVRHEIAQAAQRRAGSLALHYIFADDLHRQQNATDQRLDVDAEVRRAWQGLQERRHVLVVDGVSIDALDGPVTLHERSSVNFVRLLPLVGG